MGNKAGAPRERSREIKGRCKARRAISAMEGPTIDRMVGMSILAPAKL